MKTPTDNIPISLNQKYKLLFLSLTFLQSDFKATTQKHENDEFILKLREGQLDFIELMNQMSVNQLALIGNKDVVEFVSEIQKLFKFKVNIIAIVRGLFSVSNTVSWLFKDIDTQK